ncbi:unnamed protein product [Orchesella dallaii]|uniref:Uncharacterized protein n=1 Tax=Orchesella dallaii TaxID=48710 RepID=A0ABP1SA21_9HEXA
MYPLTIFYILPDYPTTNKKFEELDFKFIYYNPFLQIPYRITFPLVNSEINSDVPEFGGRCKELTFMCKFCNVRFDFDDNYHFSDTSINCSFPLMNGLQSTLHKLYNEITGNGRNITHFKLISLQNFDVDLTDMPFLRRIHAAPTTFKVLSLKPKLDEIILSILTETMPEPEPSKRLYWQAIHWAAVAGFGATPSFLNFGYSIIQLDTQSFNFVTCDSKRGSLFSMVYGYVQSFDIYTWLLLLLTIPMSIFMVCMVWRTLKFGKYGQLSSITLTIFASLLNTAVETRELRRNRKLRGFFSVWLLTSIILSNSYRGDSISKTTAPSKVVKAEKIVHLANFQLFSKPISAIVDIFSNFRNYHIHTELGSRIYNFLWLKLGIIEFERFMTAANNLSDPGNGKHSSFLNNFTYNKADDKEVARILFQIERLPEVNLSHRNTSLEREVYRFIGKCNKTAYIGRQQEIGEITRSFWKQGQKSMYAGTDKFLEKSGTWFIQESGGSYMKERLSYLEESGIYDFWKRHIHNSAITLDLMNSPHQVSISIDSNIAFIFYTLLLLHVISTLVFIRENVVK